MDTPLELTSWHLQCIHPPLETSKQRSRYILRADAFLERLWEYPNDLDSGKPLPPRLEVDDVENSSISFQGISGKTTSMDAVLLRFRLPAEHQGDANLFYNSVRYFCARIFDLFAKQEINIEIILISYRTLYGVTPLSNWFRLCWIYAFLDTYIHCQEPSFGDISAAFQVFPLWLKGATFIVAASPTHTFWAINTARLLDVVPVPTRPEAELKEEYKETCRAFVNKVSELMRYLNETGPACLTLGKEELPSDHEINLFNAVLGVLESCFDLLTMNGDIFTAWEKVATGTAEKVPTTAEVSGFSFAFFYQQALKAWHTVNGQARETERTQRLQKAVKSIYDATSMLAQWVVLCSNHSQTADGEEKPDLQTWLRKDGQAESSTLQDYESDLIGGVENIRQQIEEEKEFYLKRWFS